MLIYYLKEQTQELEELLKEPKFINQQKRKLKKQKNLKKLVLGWSIFFQVTGFILLHILTYYKEQKTYNPSLDRTAGSVAAKGTA